MYQIFNQETGELIIELIDPIWVKQQKRRDDPIKADNLEDADGISLYSIEEKKEVLLGIDKEYAEGEPNMLNYKPLVRVVEVPSDTYIMSELNCVKAQINAVQSDVATVQSGVSEVYNVQTYGTVPKTDLDTAYREGVNSYGE